ncbi:MAG TPA: antibiotic biosynthesis monooxygenase [Burkholderiales bacterium]
MIALFFEVQPKPEHFQRYLDMAAALKPELEKIDGFISIDRYKSLAREGVVLSHSIWRDEAALTAWRTHEGHHHAQDAGRNTVFEDYRLRIAEVLREEEPGKPAWQPQRLSAYNDPAHRRPRYMAVVESTSERFDTLPGLKPEAYASLNRQNEFVHVLDVPDLPVALELTDSCRIGTPAYRYRICEVERDYGMFERAEAPQYYPPVARPTA